MYVIISKLKTKLEIHIGPTYTFIKMLQIHKLIYKRLLLIILLIILMLIVIILIKRMLNILND